MRECFCVTGDCSTPADRQAAADTDIWEQTFPCRQQKHGIAGGVEGGVGGCSDFDAYTGISWIYDWGLTNSGWEDGGCGSARENRRRLGIEFVPQFWGTLGLDPADGVDLSVLGKARYLLTFNEPGKTDQSNLSPREAADRWPE
eukprot:gene14706-8605_t